MLKNKIFIFIAIAFFVRFVFAFLPSFQIDMNAWLGWALRLKQLGPGGFYSDNTWTQYTPGFLYYLWGIGILGEVNDLAIKIPVILADLGSAFLIWKIISQRSEKLAGLTFFLYALNPVILFTGSVWGQIDGILTLLMLLTVYFFNKGKPSISGAFWAMAFLVKPQALMLLPPLIFIAWVNKYKFKQYVVFGLVASVVILGLSLPFFPSDRVFGIVHIVEKMTGYYSYTSVFAFNIWSLVGMWKADKLTFGGISYYIWGITFFLTALGVIFWKFKSQVKTEQSKYLVIALSLLAAFLFPTRVHERYLFPMFAFLLISAGLSRSKLLFGSFFVLTFLNLVNLYHPYAYYSDNFLRNEFLLQLTGSLSKFVGGLMVAIFIMIIFFRKEAAVIIKSISRLMEKFKFSKSGYEYIEKFPKMNLGSIKTKHLLLLILLFTFVTRFYALNNPTNEYFDEVYHAFTARQMLHGDPKAWEWWNTPPEGFAYEWTHPPVAKLGMVLGMLVLGENSFGWRFPGAVLGIVSVYLVYLIARKIFKDEIVATFAAGVFALDGLVVVISRIGMNDIYFLTFALAAIYLFLDSRKFWSAVLVGLSIASKWSGLWLIPLIFVGHFVFKKKLSWSYVWFFVLPPLIYLASYIPFFMSGHTFPSFFNVNALTKCFGTLPCDQSFGVQQQMWWYHTNLKATHSYTSPWFTWPFMVRPVYLYTSDVISNYVSRIYLIGNPLVFWLGLISVAVTTAIAFVKRNRKLGYVIFCYLFFFVPWALSPRIMFLYHYLPSIPFMCISLGYVMRKYPRIIAYILVPSALLFIYFYPHWAGLSVPEWLDRSYYWFPSWR